MDAQDKAENAETFARNMRMYFERDWKDATKVDATEYWTAKKARTEMPFDVRNLDRN